MTLRVRRLTSAEAVRSIGPVWADLVGQSAPSTPFTSHDWFECCRIAAADRRQELLVVEDSVAPISLIPLVRWKGRARGLPVRYLGLLDCPDSPIADLLHTGAATPVVRALLDHVTTRSDWEVLELGRLPIGSPTLKALEAELPGRLPWRRASSDFSPYLAVDGAWSDFYASRSQRFKKTIRNIQNRLDRLGRVTVEEHPALAPGDARLEEMIDLTSRSWKADRGIAIATMPRMREFFGELSRRATERGWLGVWFLRLDGRPIAMEYQLRSNGVAYALRADYDLAYAASSPGSALNFAIARALFERGDVHEYQMGPGKNEYKMRWASGCHVTVRVQIYRPGLYGRLVHLTETRIVPALRRLRERAQ
jgi:CelD/BcsL family acetyltransferase involved in cellulose biosynthesis